MKEIAAHLAISISTVKTHLSRIFLKVDARCSLDLVTWVRNHKCQNCPYRRANGKRPGTGAV